MIAARAGQQTAPGVDAGQDQRRQQVFLGVVQDAEQLAEDELLRRQVGDQQQIQRAGIAFGGDGRHRLGG